MGGAGRLEAGGVCLDLKELEKQCYHASAGADEIFWGIPKAGI